MPRQKRIPSYRLHKPSGQARTILNGKHVYLGKFGSPESREQYARLIAEQFTPGGRDGPSVADHDGYPHLSINELLLRYLDFAESYYVKDGRPSGEVDNVKDAMRTVRSLYSHTPARDFGPRALKAVRQYMIDRQQLSRGVINSRVIRIRRVFRWAVSEELVPPGIYEGLRAVPGLRFGRCNAREAKPVRPVADEALQATLPFLPPQLGDMVMLQRLTSMRPGEVVLMRPCDINKNESVWIYEPPDHKTRYLDQRRMIALGPKAQQIVIRYFNRAPDQYMFSPRDVSQWRREQRRLETHVRKAVGEVREADQRQAQRGRKRQPGERYDTHSYRRAIRYGIRKAKAAGVQVPSWHPNQLRHSRATEVRRAHGVEGAQVVLGHVRADVTQVYAERNLDLAKQIATMTG